VDRTEYAEPAYGFWSLKKEIALMYCIWPFLQIAKHRFDSYYYLDLFAGSGMMQADEETYFVGSPIVALGGTPPDVRFNSYTCFENKPTRAAILERRLAIASNELGIGPCKVLVENCNSSFSSDLGSICSGDPRKICFLAFVDPEGLEVDWNTVERILKHCKGDLILTFATSGIMRNLEMARKNVAMGKTFTRFFGSERWQDLEVDERSIVGFYMSNLGRIRGRTEIVHNIPVKDESNHRLYDIVFVTGSRAMGNVILDLSERLSNVQTRDLRSLCHVLTGKVSQLNDFF
jgi:three-Cys-motif partner protein